MKRIALCLTLAVSMVAVTGCSVVDRLKARDHLNKGVRAYTAQDFPVAIEEFEIATKLDPSLLHAQLYLGHSYRAQFIPGIRREENLDHARRAIATFETVLAQADTPDTRDSAINAVASIAGLYLGIEEFEEAKKWHRRRIEIEPDNREPYYGIGSINQQQSANLTGNIGSNVENLSDEEKTQARAYAEEGIEFLQKALQIDPEYADALDYLNLIYRERSYLSEDEEEKLKWEREASKLALQLIEIRRKQQLEEEKSRTKVFGSEK